MKLEGFITLRSYFRSKYSNKLEMFIRKGKGQLKNFQIKSIKFEFTERIFRDDSSVILNGWHEDVWLRLKHWKDKVKFFLS